MERQSQLQEALIVRRQNLLVVDAELKDKSIVSVFCASAAVSSLCQAGMPVLLKQNSSALTRIKYELEFIKMPEAWVLANPLYRCRLFQEAFDCGVMEDFLSAKDCRAIEADEGMPHADFEITGSDGTKEIIFIESVFTKEGIGAVFPFRHNFFEFSLFEEMKKLRDRGFKTTVFILVLRMDCQEARFSWKYDPIAAAGIFEAAKNGLNFVCYSCNIEKNNVRISKKLPILY